MTMTGWNTVDYHRNRRAKNARTGEVYHLTHSVVGAVTVKVLKHQGKTHIQVNGETSGEARRGAIFTFKGYVVLRVRFVRKDGSLMLTSCDVDDDPQDLVRAEAYTIK